MNWLVNFDSLRLLTDEKKKSIKYTISHVRMRTWIVLKAKVVNKYRDKIFFVTIWGTFCKIGTTLLI